MQNRGDFPDPVAARGWGVLRLDDTEVRNYGIRSPGITSRVSPRGGTVWAEELIGRVS
jgi:hypothetical protein